jgi:AraC-like DNA-binding protein
MTESEQVEAISANMERTRQDLGLAPPKTAAPRGGSEETKAPLQTFAESLTYADLSALVEAFRHRTGVNLVMEADARPASAWGAYMRRVRRARKAR